MSEPLVLENVQILMGTTCLVRINAHVAPGNVLTIMGPSGVGKSTVLAAITGTLPPAFRLQGQIRLGSKILNTIPPHLRRVGILFQDDLLFPHMNIRQNLAFGLKPGGSARARRARIDEALEEVGLSDMGERDPFTLSGGQKARVSLMRMLLSDPKALLLDEAFSRLDADRRTRTRALVFRFAHQRHLPVIMVTHDQADADAAKGSVIHLTAPNETSPL